MQFQHCVTSSSTVPPAPTLSQQFQYCVPSSSTVPTVPALSRQFQRCVTSSSAASPVPDMFLKIQKCAASPNTEIRVHQIQHCTYEHLMNTATPVPALCRQSQHSGTSLGIAPPFQRHCTTSSHSTVPPVPPLCHHAVSAQCLLSQHCTISPRTVPPIPALENGHFDHPAIDRKWTRFQNIFSEDKKFKILESY